LLLAMETKTMSMMKTKVVRTAAKTPTMVARRSQKRVWRRRMAIIEKKNARKASPHTTGWSTKTTDRAFCMTSTRSFWLMVERSACNSGVTVKPSCLLEH